MTVAKPMTANMDAELKEWDKVHPAWMYYTLSWSRFGRAFPQFVKNGEHFKYVELLDARASIYSGYDKENLYLAIHCEDDDFISSGSTKDTLEIKLNPRPGYLQGTQSIKLIPSGNKIQTLSTQSFAKGSIVSKLKASDKAWIVEVKIPLEGFASAESGGAMGFDLVWEDADHDGKDIVTGTWRWAGKSSTLGTMFFK